MFCWYVYDCSKDSAIILLCCINSKSCFFDKKLHLIEVVLFVPYFIFNYLIKQEQENILQKQSIS